ncbi:MAG: FAD:protein FMN transferase [Deltaproteobacteria bacterium]|nr:FAD:protein FMN transferase [Deltaproteobacteria bacterium]
MIDTDRVKTPDFSRREVLALGVGAFVVATMPLAARARRVLVRRTLPVMGTIAEFAVVHRDPARAHAAIDAAMAELRRVDRLMSRFSETSEVGCANRLAAVRPAAVSVATAGVIREALGWAAATAGAFDPCIGRATRIWDVARRHVPPPQALVRPLAGRGLYRALDLATWRGEPVVGFADADVELDLGGIAKGYGVDRAAEALRRQGVHQAIVNVGGDLYALGEAGDGEPWRVGIRDPHDPAALAGEIEVRDAAVATSGDYVQYFEHRGRRYHHLLDPGTGAPRLTAVRSLTIQADTCLVADAAATALYGMPRAEAEGVLRAHAPDARLVREIGGRA